MADVTGTLKKIRRQEGNNLLRRDFYTIDPVKLGTTAIGTHSMALIPRNALVHSICIACERVFTTGSNITFGIAQTIGGSPRSFTVIGTSQFGVVGRSFTMLPQSSTSAGYGYAKDSDTYNLTMNISTLALTDGELSVGILYIPNWNYSLA